VIHPIGYDAFGLPTENAAVKANIHPAAWTRNSIDNMRKIFKLMGFSYTWERELPTCEPTYYKWCQWIFLKMFEMGLVYKKESAVNWCETCGTVLANEQVEDGLCWRCEKPVTNKDMEQWFFKITDYAEELLQSIDHLTGWPERVKTMQKNWIGKSTGVMIKFPLVGENEHITTFTTRVDTVYGATFLVVAPEHPFVKKVITEKNPGEEFISIIDKMMHEDKIVRTTENTQKEGIFTGSYAVNPMTGKKIPIYAANFVLMEYGTGAVMSVPAHDQRDFEFAKKYKLPIDVVITPKGLELISDSLQAAYVAPGILINSGDFSGIDSESAKEKIADYMQSKSIGNKTVNYKLRDWCISRQRYWETPIPIIICDDCGNVPVPYEDLPVILPEEVEFKTVSLSPLIGHKPFHDVKCPKCGKKAKRETDTMDTFVDSSFYFIRYCDPKNSKVLADPAKTAYWMPVDIYIGGIEHAIMHLLYARFISKILRDCKIINVDEPFVNLLTQGMVIKDGRKMSKSLGNTVDPVDMMDKYGVDTIRLFLLFAAPPEKDFIWDDKGIEGMFRFINRIYRLVDNNLDLIKKYANKEFDGKLESPELKKLSREIHSTIKKVTFEIDSRMHFNTAISAAMELINTLYLVDLDKTKGESDEFKAKAYLFSQGIKTILLLLNPFIPHLCEECWSMIDMKTLIQQETWPQYDEDELVQEEKLIIVQINKKVRAKFNINADASDEEIKNAALSHERVIKTLEDLKVQKVIITPNKLVNIVAK
ncbi:leucine--tRNA ligase, partial [bacterium]|nr:leucine--tRNA ligase [bacterium]